MVEVVEESLVERQTGTQNRGHNNVIINKLHLGLTQRSLDHLGGIVQLFREFIGRDLANALEVAAESHRVLLDVLVAQLGQKGVQNRVLLV